MIGEYPLVERNVRIFHDGSDCHCEWFIAVVAPMNARARALASKLRNARWIGISAVAAGDAVRPIQPLKVFAGFGGVSENWICKFTHGLTLD